MSERPNPYWEDVGGPIEAERRASIRYQWSLMNFCPLFASVEGDTWLAKVQNISAHGISLIMRQWVEPGTILNVELTNTTQLFLCKLQVRVTYVLEYANGYWMLGGAFMQKLEEEEIRKLLA